MPRKPTAFTPDQLDEAKRLLGKVIYASRAVGQLCRKYQFGRELGYKLLDAAKEDVLKGLVEAGAASDPASAAAMFFLSIMSDGKHAVRDRIAAGVGLTRLLSTSRRTEAAATDEVEGFLGKLLAQQLIRKRQGEGPES